MVKIRSFCSVRHGQIIAILFIIIWPYTSLCNENADELDVTSLESWKPYVERLFSSYSNKSFDDSSLLKPEHYFGDKLVLISPTIECRSRDAVIKTIEQSFNKVGYIRSFDAPKHAITGCLTLVKNDNENKKILRTCVRAYSYFGLCKYSYAMFGVELKVQGEFAEEKYEERDRFIGDIIEILAVSISGYGGHLDTSQ